MQAAVEETSGAALVAGGLSEIKDNVNIYSTSVAFTADVGALCRLLLRRQAALRVIHLSLLLRLLLLLLLVCYAGCCGGDKWCCAGGWWPERDQGQIKEAGGWGRAVH
jgi:hypothetical protein